MSWRKHHGPSFISCLAGRNAEVPFVFVADDAFPLSINIMKPFREPQEKGSKNSIFNYRLSRGRRVSENAVGILSYIFRVLRKPMLLETEKAKKATLPVLYLHNFLRKNTSKNIYNPSDTFDLKSVDDGSIIPRLWIRDISNSHLQNIPKVARTSTTSAQNIRNEFKEYFSSPEGELPFQYKI